MRTPLLAFLPAAALWLADAAAPPEPPKPPELFTARPGPFAVELKLDGIVDHPGACPVRLDFKRATDLVVLEAAAAGTPVSLGDVILRLDPRKLNEAIEDQRAACELAGLALRLAQKEEAALAARTALDLPAAARQLARAQEDLAHHEEIDRPRAAEQVEFGLKSSRDRLAYEQEELGQLEKMYKDDDLTEETEEIVLRRQRDAVEAATFQVRQAELQRDRVISVQLPRASEDLKDRLEHARIDAEQAQATLPLKLEQKRAETRRLEREQARQAIVLAEMEADREALTVKAPIAGTVHYGPAERGRFPQAEALTALLRPHGRLTPQAVVMTIVVPAGLLKIQATVNEAELNRDLLNMACAVMPEALPGRVLHGRIEMVEHHPLAERRHAITISLGRDEELRLLRPLWHVQVRVQVYRADKAITVPLTAVQEDPMEPGRHLVYLPGEGGPPQPRTVTLGQRGATRVEILEGLEPGSAILAQAPPTP